MGESIFTDQFESYIQQVEFLKNLPDIGKGVKRRHYKFWETIGANQFILDKLKKGYVVPLKTVPPRMRIKKHLLLKTSIL